MDGLPEPANRFPESLALGVNGAGDVVSARLDLSDLNWARRWTNATAVVRKADGAVGVAVGLALPSVPCFPACGGVQAMAWKRGGAGWTACPAGAPGPLIGGADAWMVGTFNILPLRRHEGALKQVQAGKPRPTVNRLKAFLNEFRALEKTGRLPAANVVPSD